MLGCAGTVAEKSQLNSGHGASYPPYYYCIGAGSYLYRLLYNSSSQAFKTPVVLVIMYIRKPVPF
jgi:hypothetical protein